MTQAIKIARCVGDSRLQHKVLDNFVVTYQYLSQIQVNLLGILQWNLLH
jgi:hypothetical protein